MKKTGEEEAGDKEEEQEAEEEMKDGTKAKTTTTLAVIGTEKERPVSSRHEGSWQVVQPRSARLLHKLITKSII